MRSGRFHPMSLTTGLAWAIAVCSLAADVSTEAQAQAPAQTPAQAPEAKPAPAWADLTSADLAPDDVGLFIRFENLSDAHTRLQRNRLVREIVQSLLGAQREAWLRLLGRVGLTHDQAIDELFGMDVALVGRQADLPDINALITRFKPGAAQRLIDRLAFTPTSQQKGFQLYASRDRATVIAVREPWMMLANVRNTGYLGLLLNRLGTEPLSGERRYREMVEELPDRPPVLAYYRHDERATVGGLAMTYDQERIDLRLSVRSPAVALLLGRMAPAAASAWSPAPRGSVAAAVFNLARIEPGDTTLWDRFIAPRTIAEHVAPHLKGPHLAFAGFMPRDAVDPDVGFAFPAVGVAIGVDHPEAVATLDQLFDGVTLLFNISTAGWQTPFVPVEQRQYEDVTYRVAEVGRAAASRAERHEIAPLQLVGGWIGDHYIVCTQEAMFKRCVQASRDRDQAYKPVMPLTQPADEGAGPERDGAAPAQATLANVEVRADELARGLANVVDYLLERRPLLLRQALAVRGNEPSLIPPSPETYFALQVVNFCDMVDHHKLVRLRVSVDGVDRLKARFSVAEQTPSVLPARLRPGR